MGALALTVEILLVLVAAIVDIYFTMYFVLDVKSSAFLHQGSSWSY